MRKLENENEYQYIWRVCSAKDNGTLDCTWEEIADILNKNIFEDETEYLGSSAFRKKYQQAKAFYENVFLDMNSADDIMEQKRELERMRIQYRDDRNEWNKQNRVDARVSQKLDYLEEKLLEKGKYDFKCYQVKEINGESDMLVILSDLHIGQTFRSNWGEYNTDIAKKRMEKLLNEVLKIRERHNSKNIYVSIQGDLISGNIHKTIQVSNRENVIDQIKIACELISSFCYELGKSFSHVYITNVSGNHSRIDRKDDAIHDERLDDLIGWFVSKELEHIQNISFLDNANIDNGVAVMEIYGKKYVNCHGDYDNFTKSGVSNLVLMLGYLPYAVTFGHMHSCAIDEANGIKMIRGGSLAGSGDSYAIEKRLNGKPSQMVCVCNSEGVSAYYPIELS